MLYLLTKYLYTIFTLWGFKTAEKYVIMMITENERTLTMNDALKVMEERRSCRDFKPDLLPDDILEIPDHQRERMGAGSGPDAVDRRFIFF